ncbi:hypothetical protein R1sor_002455 [Riccia sorocarpa]|uniref:Uncharacterized protein n=1 Tax=Riccia sorocarpa TaxID=122646 RepID=A0ABD3GZ85_9MARC
MTGEHANDRHPIANGNVPVPIHHGTEVNGNAVILENGWGEPIEPAIVPTGWGDPITVEHTEPNWDWPGPAEPAEAAEVDEPVEVDEDDEADEPINDPPLEPERLTLAEMHIQLAEATTTILHQNAELMRQNAQLAVENADLNAQNAALVDANADLAAQNAALLLQIRATRNFNFLSYGGKGSSYTAESILAG